VQDDQDDARRGRAARLERWSRHAIFGVVPISLLGASDLATGWLGNGWRLDTGLLGVCALMSWSAISTRRMRRVPQRLPSVRAVAVSGVISIAAAVGIGYLVGGWIVAIVLPAAAYGVAVALGFAIWWRQRRSGEEGFRRRR
jgi:hypothetical protein